jgi:hypothetical protein
MYCETYGLNISSPRWFINYEVGLPVIPLLSFKLGRTSKPLHPNSEHGTETET